MASLRILSWNIFQLPDLFSRQGQSLRRGPIMTKLAHYADTYGLDAVVLSEVFNEDAHDELFRIVAGPGKRFAFASERPTGAFGSVNDGGVMILARAGAEPCFVEAFSDGIGTDFFAGKGAVGVRIRKGGRTALVVGTHMQASAETCPCPGEDREAESRVTRAAQLRQLRAWIATHRRPGERLVVAGDLNVDGGAAGTADDVREYEAMRLLLGVAPAPTWLPQTTLRHTFDPTLNTLAQRTCGADFRFRMLDHILMSGPQAGARQWISWPRTPTPWRRQHVSLSRCDHRGNSTEMLVRLEDRDISDHFPMIADIPI
jgi:hypothetical protein